jgi:hypothetical protein
MGLLWVMCPHRDARRVPLGRGADASRLGEGPRSDGGNHVADSGVLPVCHPYDVNLRKAVG